MALLSNFKSDHMLKAVGQELDARYGKGEIYKNFDHVHYRETYTHVTEDRIKRTFELDKFAMERNLRGNEWSDALRLLSEDYSHRHSMTFPSYPIEPEMSPASMAYHEKMRGQYIKEKYEDKPKKKSKLKGNIRERLQKETDNWLKSVQKEED